MTGCRIKRIQKYVDTDDFMLTYGDGVAGIDIRKLYSFHKSHGKIGTITAVHPPSRFGGITIGAGSEVLQFKEKPQVQNGGINGGFFCFKRSFFDYLSEDERCTLEREPIEKLVSDRQLVAFKHTGFWQCMDTYRDYVLLNNLWESTRDWKVWE